MPFSGLNLKDNTISIVLWYNICCLVHSFFPGFFNCAAQQGMFKMTWKCQDAARQLRDCVTKV